MMTVSLGLILGITLMNDHLHLPMDNLEILCYTRRILAIYNLKWAKLLGSILEFVIGKFGLVYNQIPLL